MRLPPLHQCRLPVCLSLLSLSLSLMLAAPAQGATRRWQGDGGNPLWSNPANWEGDVVPVNGDDIVFPATAVNDTATNDLTLAVVGVTFEKSFTLNGSTTLDLGSGGIVITMPPAPSGTNKVILELPIRLTADQVWKITNAHCFVSGALGLNQHKWGSDVDPNSRLVVTSTGSIGDDGQIVKTGPGGFELGAINTYAGTTTVDNGVLTLPPLPHTLGLGDGTAANGTIVNADPAQKTAGSLQFLGAKTGNEAFTFTGMPSGGRVLGASGLDSAIGGPVVLTNAVVFDVSANITLRMNGPIGGPGGLVVRGDGALELNHADSTFAGGLVIGQGTAWLVTVIVGANNAIPPASTPTVATAARLVIDGVGQTLAGIAGAGTIALPTTSSALVLTGSGVTTFDGTLQGVGLITHTGEGLLRLTGQSTFTGAVTVDHGGIEIAGGALPATVTVNDDGRVVLSAAATVGTLLIHGGWLHLPSIGVALTAPTAAGLTMQPVARLTAEGTTTGKLGTLAVNGPVTIDGATLEIVLPDFFAAAPGTAFVLIANDGTDAVTGTFAGLPEGATVKAAGATFQLAYAGGTGNDVVLTLTEIARDYLLSEGATGSFFDTDILIANTNASAAPIRLTFLGLDGAVSVVNDEVAGMSRKTISIDALEGLAAMEFGTVVRSLSGLPLVVERTMRWDQSGYGAHTDHAVEGAAQSWYFAEGSQGFFHTYLLLANPQSVENTTTVEFLPEAAPPITRTYAVPASSRLTVDLGADAALKDLSFGMVVTFEEPGLAERAMYFGAEPLWSGGHASAGVPAPATEWLLAEGATGTFFETFILLANPGADPADATLRFLRQGASPVETTRTIPAHGRVTLNLEQIDPGLAAAAVATHVTATRPIVVERAQYWPDPAPQWYESHNSFGVTALGTTWGLAEGRVGGPQDYRTYILLANPGSQMAEVAITFLRETGPPVAKTFTVPAGQRLTVALDSDVPEIAGGSFGALIASDRPIAVERAMYASVNGQFWAAGTSATAVPLP